MFLAFGFLQIMFTRLCFFVFCFIPKTGRCKRIQRCVSESGGIRCRPEEACGRPPPANEGAPAITNIHATVVYGCGQHIWMKFCEVGMTVALVFAVCCWSCCWFALCAMRYTGR